MPLALSVGIIFAINSLHTYNIYCTNSIKVIEAGKIKSCVFDKTGTLTDNSITIKGCFQLEDKKQKPFKNYENNNDVVDIQFNSFFLIVYYI